MGAEEGVEEGVKIVELEPDGAVSRSPQRQWWGSSAKTINQLPQGNVRTKEELTNSTSSICPRHPREAPPARESYRHPEV